jgi:hypothetical protein
MDKYRFKDMETNGTHRGIWKGTGASLRDMEKDRDRTWTRGRTGTGTWTGTQKQGHRDRVTDWESDGAADWDRDGDEITTLYYVRFAKNYSV